MGTWKRREAGAWVPQFSSTDRPASSVTFDDSGLIVVDGADVQAALEDVDAFLGTTLPATYAPLSSIDGSTVAAEVTTTSTTFVTLTGGPAATVTVGASGILIVHLTIQGKNDTAAQFANAAVALSGANTLAAATGQHWSSTGNLYNRYGVTMVFTGLAAGSTTATVHYASSSGGTARFQARTILAIAP